MPTEFNLLFWPLATVLAYVCARLFYRRYAYWWTSTLVVAPALLLALALSLHTGYRDYMSGSHWLMMMLSPVIVAFALPLYEQRVLIRRYGPCWWRAWRSAALLPARAPGCWAACWICRPTCA